ncbi:unnamed protein product [Arabidopsis halleri]
MLQNGQEKFDGKTVTVAYRVTLYGTDAEIFRESTWTTSVDDRQG